MFTDNLKKLLAGVQDGSVSIDAALGRMKDLPFEDLGFAVVDHHRALRKGYPEVIFCQGKTPGQILEIFTRLSEGNNNILGTRASQEAYREVLGRFPEAEYSELARTLVINRSVVSETYGKVLVISAGTTDLPVAEEAAVTAEVLGNQVRRVYDVGVAGLHRLLDKLELIRWAHVIIVVAGMEGALPSVIGGLAEQPVIAVPTSVGYGASFNGLAALLGMLNSCASGLAVVNIDNGFGAGAMAGAITRQIVSVHSPPDGVALNK